MSQLSFTLRGLYNCERCTSHNLANLQSYAERKDSVLTGYLPAWVLLYTVLGMTGAQGQSTDRWGHVRPGWGWEGWRCWGPGEMDTPCLDYVRGSTL